jgi:hypothetical protein
LKVRPCFSSLLVLAETVRHAALDRVADLARLSGRSDALSDVRTAFMPQPMSTPTAAGMIAPFVAITLPTVAPMPKCTSGMAATPCLWMNGELGEFFSCCRAESSISSVHSLIGLLPSSWITCFTVAGAVLGQVEDLVVRALVLPLEDEKARAADEHPPVEHPIRERPVGSAIGEPREGDDR